VRDKLLKETFLGNGKRDLFFLLCLALGVRILVYKFTYLIAIDGATFYLGPAQYFASGQWMEGLGSGYHPLYPLLVALFSMFLGDFQFSGQMISILFGALTVIPVYYLTKGMFHRWAGFLSSLFLAILPHHATLSADFLSDTTYIFLFVSAVWVGWKALRTEDWKIFFLAGVVAALAYLTRAEGIGALLILSLWVPFRKSGLPYLKKGITLLALLVSFLLIASPYIFYLRSYTGTWAISRKPSVNRVVVLIKEKLLGQQTNDKAAKKFDGLVKQLKQRDNAKPGFSRWLRSTGTFFKFFVETFHPLFFLFFIIGVIRRKIVSSWTGERFLLANLLLCAAILYWLASISYVSHRYFVPFVTLCLPWSGRGLAEARRWFEEKISAQKWEKVRLITAGGFIPLILLVAFTVLPITIQPQREGKLGRKEAGLWIKNNSMPSPLIYTNMVRVNYYAEGKLILLKEENIQYKEMIDKAKKGKANFLVISDKTIKVLCPEFFDSLKPEDLGEVFRTDKGGEETIIVYRVQR
jgi:4-amino-4-deoxy-L-arabinose transferase-like glycosyltransferase